MIYAVLALVVLALACNAFMDSLWHSYGGSVGWRLAGRPAPETWGVNPSWWGHAQHVWLRRYNLGPNGEPRSPQYGLRGYMANPITGAIVTPWHDAWHLAKLVMMGSFLTALAVALPSADWWWGLAAYPVVGVVWEAFYALWKREPFMS